MKVNSKEVKIISATLAIWGIFLIGSGLIINTSNRTIVKKTYNLSVSQKKVAEAKTNELKLKDMTLEINNPLSVDVKDYLEDVNLIDNSILKALKLDTSNVNINQAGSYIYTITFKNKKYNGTFVIKEKELPQQELTLKTLTLDIGSALSTNLTSYINEELTEEVKNHITLDLSSVDTTKAGTYQYSVIYNGKIYTSSIVINEPHTTIITNNNNNSNNTYANKKPTDTTVSTQ